MDSDEADRDENAGANRENRDSGVGDIAIASKDEKVTLSSLPHEAGLAEPSATLFTHECSFIALEHQIWLLTLEGKLYLSPIDQVYNVLDICTGTGLWAISMAHQFPGARIIGNDLSPITPPRIPENCQFEVEDVEEFPWVYSHKFDFIHARSVFACFDNTQRVINEAVESLEDDGWLEIQDWLVPMRCDDGSWDGTAVGPQTVRLRNPNTTICVLIDLSKIKRLVDTGAECLQKAGRVDHTGQLPDMFRKAGLVDVKEETILWPMNPWAKGQRNKEAGLLWMELNKEGLESMTLALLTRYGDMSKDEAMELITMARVDLRDTKIHAYLPATIVMGRKAP
ncbi:hypothetical protein PG993_000387 [Apiospora rasikravindrae]|uniref:Methyltransferase n=1 Tax=Apiospora rasikravindrae TaxID=990691 RepID=A0ABR1UAR1_9PEZI